MTEANRSLRVFLCHSSDDKATVRELHRRLDAEGWIDAWLDEEKLYPGHDWNYEIGRAVKAADIIIVCLTKNSVSKEGYIQRELRMVLDQADYKPEGTLFIIPVRLEECEPPGRLYRWHYVDYFPLSDRDRAYSKLLLSLRNRATALGTVTAVVKSKAVPPKLENMAKSTPSGYPIYVFDDIEFMKVPAGRFLMGMHEGAGEIYAHAQPQHLVDIKYDYYVGRFPITNEQYAKYVKAKGIKHPVSEWERKLDHPVVLVAWNDAMAYCQWLCELLATELPFGLALRLPTEAEWEKAARGSTGLKFPWGDHFDPNKCNASEGGKGDTTHVGAYSPQGDSPYGCADMCGNVLEWTHSVRKNYPYQPNDGREDESSTKSRVLRGGSFMATTEGASTMFRNPAFGSLSYLSKWLGFRVVVAPRLS